jgi:hypothetical protein
VAEGEDSGVNKTGDGVDETDALQAVRRKEEITPASRAEKDFDFTRC